MNDEKTAADYKVSGKRRNSSSTAETHFLWETDERRENSCRLQSFWKKKEFLLHSRDSFSLGNR